MNVLLDECTPHVLKRLLTDFHVWTVQELGWAGITNGALIERAEGRFDVLVTSDQNLKYQQNLTGRQIAIIQLPTNAVPAVIRLEGELRVVLANIKAGQIIEIRLPGT